MDALHPHSRALHPPTTMQLTVQTQRGHYPQTPSSLKARTETFNRITEIFNRIHFSVIERAGVMHNIAQNNGVLMLHALEVDNGVRICHNELKQTMVRYHPTDIRLVLKGLP